MFFSSQNSVKGAVTCFFRNKSYLTISFVFSFRKDWNGERNGTEWKIKDLENNKERKGMHSNGGK